PFHAADPGALDDNPESFTPGTSPGVLQGFVPLGVSICHEILYPELLRDDVRAGAALLVNVSNDGWVDGGHGTAAPQHLAMATFRAVETHRYLARAATTGISAIIDPYGRVLAQLGTGKAGVVVAPVAGRTELTPYVRLGDAFAFGCALLAVAALRSRRRVARTARRAQRALLADVAFQRAA
ncbi:MAG TPA: apolipoprotein N-acyltransferase, partial [Candidatus Binatus sp.]|nr:apolipoprotein N-acyltransferase [Candidatus Binatus sp.]